MDDVAFLCDAFSTRCEDAPGVPLWLQTNLLEAAAVLHGENIEWGLLYARCLATEPAFPNPGGRRGVLWDLRSAVSLVRF